MAQDVFILGAGASQQGGAPLMNNFLDTAFSLYWKNKVSPQNKEHFKKVIEAVGILQHVHSKAHLDHINLESVFATFEMAAALNKFGEYPPSKITALIESMRILIVETIEKTLGFPFIEKSLQPPRPYMEYAKLINHLCQEVVPNRKAAIITFNYDIAVDFALSLSGMPVSYALENSPQGIPLLKLHGSMNWARCTGCKKIVPVNMDEFFSKIPIRFPLPNMFIPIAASLKFFECKACKIPLPIEPVIVPPTWDKSQYREGLRSVWARAAKELTDAERIYVMGFSLPPTDSFFRQLYALGTAGPNPLNRFWVFDVDETGAVEGRFRNLLGSGALPRFNYFKHSFENGIKQLLQSSH